MSVTIIPVGVLKSFFDWKEVILLEGKQGKSLELVCQEIGLPIGVIDLFFVNGKLVSKDYVLRSGDEIKLVTLAAGG